MYTVWFGHGPGGRREVVGQLRYTQPDTYVIYISRLPRCPVKNVHATAAAASPERAFFFSFSFFA